MDRYSAGKLDLTMIFRFTVRLHLRYAAHNHRRPACTHKYLRRLVYVFRRTSSLRVTSHLRRPMGLQSACSITNVHVYDLQFTIRTIPIKYSVPSCRVILHWSPDLETATVTSDEKRSFTKNDFTIPTKTYELRDVPHEPDYDCRFRPELRHDHESEL